MLVIIEIKQIGSSIYVEEKTVAVGNTVEIKNTTNKDVSIFVPNKDGFFNSSSLAEWNTVISDESLDCGSVTANGNSIKYFNVDPSPSAPPRIIRIS